jgi:DNA topoisomerase-6 subunit B
VTSGTRELSAKGLFLNSSDYPTGTSVSIELEGRYQRGRGSVDEFLELTAIANPHAKITLVPPTRESQDDDDDLDLLKKAPKGAPAPGGEVAAPVAAVQPQVTTETGGVILFPRGVAELPPETQEIQPHPKGIELGILLQMLKEAEAERAGYTLYNFLQDKFSRISAASASKICESIKLTSRSKVADIEPDVGEKLFRALQEADLPPPPTDCLAPIGVRQMLAGLLKGVRAEFYAASTREPNVYRGRPFQIEAAIAYGGDLPREDSARVVRFANRVPLLFQQSGCSSFKAATETNWRNYDLQQPRGAVPVGPLVIMIHMASVWVPFTSESKEAIADYDEIRKEMRLALMECGRKLGGYLKKRARLKREGERRDVFQKYIGEISKACAAITGADAKKIYDALQEQARAKTAIADMELDEEGKRIKHEDPADQEGVIVVESASGGDAPPTQQSKAEAAAIKVAALAHDESGGDEQLIAVAPVKRSATREPKSSKVSKSEKPATKALDEISTEPKPAKPRMRLINGKLVPVDEPKQGLFDR